MSEVESITVRRSGGLLGQTTAHTIATSGLSPEHKSQLDDLCARVGASQSKPANRQQRDGFSYVLHIKTASGALELEMHDGAMDGNQQALLNLVKQLQAGTS